MSPNNCVTSPLTAPIHCNEEISPLDFTKRAIPARLDLHDTQTHKGISTRRSSLLSDAIRSPNMDAEFAHTSSGASTGIPNTPHCHTPGILKHSQATDTHMHNGQRQLGSCVRAHFVEPVKPARKERMIASRAKSAPVSPARRLSNQHAERSPLAQFCYKPQRSQSHSPFTALRSQDELFTAPVFADDDELSELEHSPFHSQGEFQQQSATAQLNNMGESDGGSSVGHNEDEVDDDSDEYISEDDNSLQKNGINGQSSVSRSVYLKDAKPNSSSVMGNTQPVSEEASLSHLCKRRALSFGDVSPEPESSCALPLRRTLSFAPSPMESNHEGHLRRSRLRRQCRRKMIASPMVSSSSSLVTNLFEAQIACSPYGSDYTDRSTTDDHHDFALSQSAENNDATTDLHAPVLRSPHLIKSRPPSPKPQSVASSTDDDDADDDDGSDEAFYIEMQEDAALDSDMSGSNISGAQHPISPGQRKRNIRSKRHTILNTAFELDGDGGDDDDDDSHDVISTQIRALELSPSTSDATSATHNDCDLSKCPDASESLQRPSYNNHARDFAGNHQQSACRSCRAQQTQVGKSRRTSVLHSLLQTEPRMSFAGPKVEQLDRTDELAIAAELLLLHKSSNSPLDSRRTTSLSHTAQSDDDSEDSETASVRHMSSADVCSERGQCSSTIPVLCDECTLSQCSQAISPSTLSFRREREQNATRAESVSSYLHCSTTGSPDTLHRARQSRSLTPHFRRISTHTTPSITAQLATSPNDAVTAQSAPLAYGTRSESVPSHVQ